MKRGHLYQRNGTYNLQYTTPDGKRVNHCLCTDDDAVANDLRDEIMGRIGHVRDQAKYLQKMYNYGMECKAELDGITVEIPICLVDVWKLFMASKKRPPSSDNMILDYQMKWGTFLERHGWHIKITDVSPGVASLYIDWLENRYTSNTVNKHISCLRMIWRALDIEPNPWEGLRSTKKDKAVKYRRLTVDECRLAYAEAPKDLKNIIMIAYYTGQRRKDILGMTPPVDKVIHVTQAKTGQSVVIPAMNELLDYLIVYTSYSKASLCCENYTFKPERLTKDMRRLFKNCGIEDNEHGKASLHSFRATFASLMAEAGAPDHVIRSVTGHKKGDQLETYVQADVEVAREWMEKALPPLATC